ncbi:hypothetical protein ACQP1P_09835 [Dactylosporangium sp. CA-052675]|uniref:hypothetical protein n=1 Tax=Dactylosporangium sp. CA-052675 TaxID=3239927 RepID=UPI003D92220E
MYRAANANPIVVNSAVVFANFIRRCSFTAPGVSALPPRLLVDSAVGVPALHPPLLVASAVGIACTSSAAPLPILTVVICARVSSGPSFPALLLVRPWR